MSSESLRLPDVDLLKAIRDDLAASPFIGEGRRKVWARLRILSDIRVSRTRVLRLMRGHSLLSPHRRARGEPNLHDGRVTTDCPNEMWGTGGVRIATVDDDMVWVFSAVDHCDGMCTSIHTSKIGDPRRRPRTDLPGLLDEFRPVAADAGRGLSPIRHAVGISLRRHAPSLSAKCQHPVLFCNARQRLLNTPTSVEDPRFLYSKILGTLARCDHHVFRQSAVQRGFPHFGPDFSSRKPWVTRHFFLVDI